MATRIGVDVGGTFTDLISYDAALGEVRVAKGMTNADALEKAVIGDVESAVPVEIADSCEYFLHGSTIALNSLLERRGATVGLLATAGFRDVLEIRRGDRGEMLNLRWRAPTPLVPRRLRIPVRERIRADGSVYLPLDEEDIYRAVGTFAGEGVASIAVAFLNAYVNPEHELAAEYALRRFGFGGEISLSHRVSGEYREYERTSTTVIDAYVRPKTARYLRRIEKGLRGLGCRGELLMTRSGGGAMRFEEAIERPFETILSGPVAGAQGAADLARELELPNVIAADVGGTSFDACLVLEGRPQMMYEGDVLGFPLQAPWVDVRSIGAGGGSIAYVDAGGLLRVGPRSAGAVPGPASYGRGGTEPTVTDSALVLGMLAQGKLAGGLELDLDRAEAALAPLAATLAADVRETARDVLTIATASMADAVYEITVERGEDPRTATLMAFGGAGPLFATLLAREFGIAQIVIPPHAGNFSAWGLLVADVVRTAARTHVMPLSDDAIRNIDALLSELFTELATRGGGGRVGKQEREAGLDLRYAGQEYSLTVSVPTRDDRLDASPEEIAESFGTEYRRTYGHDMEDDVEVVSVRATLRTALPRPRRHRAEGGSSSASVAQTLPAYSFTRKQWNDFELHDRATLDPSSTLVGPVLVTEPTAMTYLDAGWSLNVDQTGCLMLTPSGEWP
jgi:N-methylhydantoinase A